MVHCIPSFTLREQLASIGQVPAIHSRLCHPRDILGVVVRDRYAMGTAGAFNAELVRGADVDDGREAAGLTIQTDGAAGAEGHFVGLSTRQEMQHYCAPIQCKMTKPAAICTRDWLLTTQRKGRVMATSKHTLCGIYKIQNLVNGKVYIGSSANIKLRFGAHRSRLGRGTHHSIFLQRAWSKHGSANFSFAILELVRIPARLHIAENRHIQEFRSSDKRYGYNVCPAAGSLLGIKFGPQSEAHRRKIGDAHLGKVNSAETRAKLSAALKGRTFDAAWLAKMSQAHTGRKMAPLTAAHKAIVSATHKGKTISDAHKARLSAAHKGRKQSDEDRANKRSAGAAYWATQTPEQRTARTAKAAATKAAGRSATPPPAFQA
jgi:group I intron endonuclease